MLVFRNHQTTSDKAISQFQSLASSQESTTHALIYDNFFMLPGRNSTKKTDSACCTTMNNFEEFDLEPFLSPTTTRFIFHKNVIQHPSIKTLDRLPEKLDWIDLSLNDLTSSIPISHAALSNAKHLLVLNLSENNLKTVSSSFFSSLPPSLTRLDISRNQIADESPDFSQLPNSLRFLLINNNQFCGDLDLTKLPKSLEVLKGSRNNFTNNNKKLNLDFLPQNLQILELTHNKNLSAEIVISKSTLPQSLEVLDFTKCFKISVPCDFFRRFAQSHNDDDDDDHKNENVSKSPAPNNHRLRRISFSGCKLKETIFFPEGCIPPSLEVLDFSNNKLTQPPFFLSSLAMKVVKRDSSLLHSSFTTNCCLRYLDFSRNNLRGELPDFSCLPGCVRHLDFSQNELTIPKHSNNNEINDIENDIINGFENPLQMKKSMKKDNNYSQNPLERRRSPNPNIPSYDLFSRLPKCLVTLDLSQNKLSGFNNGKIDLTKLPPNLETFDLSDNVIEGELILASSSSENNPKEEEENVITCDLPKSLERIVLNHNKISGTVNLTRLPRTLQKLNLAENCIEFLEGGPTGCFRNLPPVLDSVDLTSNCLSMEDLDLSVENLPSTLEKLHLGDNRITGRINFGNMSRNLKQLFLQGNFLVFDLMSEVEDVFVRLRNLSTLDLSGNDIYCSKRNYGNDKSVLEVMVAKLESDEKEGKTVKKKMRSINVSGNAESVVEELNDGEEYFENEEFFAVQF